MNETRYDRFDELERKKEMRKMKSGYSLSHRFIAAILSLVLVFSVAPTFTMAEEVQSASSLNIVAGSKVADTLTLDDWKQFFGSEKMDTEYAGAVWTDKSVFAAESELLPGVTLNDSNNFLVALSAIAGNYTITGHATVPTDTMLVLDLSSSMLKSVEYGPFDDGDMVTGVDVSNVAAMLDATNDAIATLMEQNSNNRVGVVLYSGNTSTNNDATSSTATVLLPLGRYEGIAANGGTEFLSLDATVTTQYIYENLGSNRRPNWQPTDQQVTYYSGNVFVKVASGLTTDTGASVTNASKQVNGGTYIQNGLYKAMQEFLKVTDTVVPEGNPQAGTQRMPVMVLMSDGAPTIATTNYANVGTSNTGTGSGTNDRITMLTQLTAAYVRGAIIDHYKESASDEQEMLFLTLGLGTSSNTAATNTLYPAGSSTAMVGYWNTYLAAQAGRTITINVGGTNMTVQRNALVTAMDYVDKYFYAANAEEMIASFEQIISEIKVKAETYNTLVTGGDADLSGHIIFEDSLGEMMEVKQVKGILMDNSSGSVVLYTGKSLAEGMTTGKLGTVDGPTARGDELVRAVKARIPGLTTSTAQQLINNAYNDQQLFYESDSNWSNYIGWYADADGNYIGFWDKDSGYDNAPEGAVYANKSYGYLGVVEDSDMMYVVVQVRTNLQTRNQTVHFEIPAVLIPAVTYNVTLAKDDPTKVESLVREDALPMRLVFEVGLRSDLNAVNLEQKIAEHVAAGGHVHKNADGTYSFYTNSWVVGNDKNNNGIPDPDEVKTAVVTSAHFNPALDNGRFYFTEDTLVLDASGNVVTGDTQPSGTTYQHARAIYTATERTYAYMPMSADTVAKAQKNADGQWYIPAGTPYLEWSQFRAMKGENKSGALDYIVVPAAFTNATTGIDTYVFLGNNGTLKLAPATGIALTKKVDGVIADAAQYTFTVSVPAGVAANPIVTDANGDPLTGVTVTAWTNGSFDVTVPADVTAYITGIPAGTAVTVTEKIEGDYHVSGIAVNGLAQSAGNSVQVTVPAVTDTVKIAQVEFTNSPNGYGDLTVIKDVTHNLGTDPDVLATKVFTFQVTLAGDKISAGDTFQTSTGVDVKVADDGTLTYTNGEAITLHNDESVTVYRIPEGTAYTVVETDIPSGFVFDTATSSTGIIDKDATDVAEFVNRYPDAYTSVSVPLDLTVHKVLEGTPANEEIFEFALQQLLPDNTYPDQKVYQISSLAADKTVNDTSVVLQFADLGTYYYRIVEKIPDSMTPGMTYSTTRALFAVVVTDADMDGVLEVEVREEANITANATYADPADKETVTGVAVEATFTNVYQVYSTNTAVHIHKDLVNATGVDIPLTSFQFGLYEMDADGNATGDPIQVVTSSALGDATFNIVITEDKDLAYIIKEIIPSPKKAGMTYDEREYVLSIDVTAATDGQLSAVSSVKLKGTDAQTAVVFQNTYSLTPATTVIHFSKTLTGRAPLENETFSFQLVRTDAAYQPLTGADAYAQTHTVPVGQHQISLGQDESGKQLFDKVGTYYFKLTELAGTASGLSYDKAEYRITVTVTDNGSGALVAMPVMHKVGLTDAVTSADFTNTYTVTGSGSVVIDGKKILSGRGIIANEFQFGLYTDHTGEPIQTVTNRADGSFLFSALHFTAADLGTNNSQKVYTYYVKEILPAGTDTQGVTYDNTIHVVTVTVSHDNNGNLVVTPSTNHTQSIVINNAYNAQGVNVTLHGMKLLTGDWSAVQNKTFSFQLFEADANYQVTNSTPIVVTNNTNGEFSFQLSFSDGEEGNHYYILREDTFAEAGGVSYDASVYRVLVNVTDPGTGKLSAMVSMNRPGTGDVANDATLGAPVAVFSNGYAVEPTQIVLEAKKILTGRDLIAGEFTFHILEGTKVIATGTNAADGTVTFPAINYTTAGIHTYLIQEVKGDASGIEYDDTVFAVTVTVTDNGSGQLIATPNYSVPVEFENVYTADKTDDVVFAGEKNLTGRDLAAGEFEFVLKDSTGATVETVKNAADGTITFTGISYNAVGTYKYTVSEVIGTLGGVTYDDAVFEITVTVTDPGDGKLEAAVQYSAPVVFNNSYKAQKTDAVILEGHKNLTGRDLMEGEFSFALKNAAGATVEIVSNDANGDFIFAGIAFDRVGVYEYTINEVAGALGGVTYDDAVFEVTVTVTDPGDGKLVADVQYSAPVVFHNTYEAKLADFTFEADKHLIDISGGGNVNIAVPADRYEFQVKDALDNVMATVKADANGKIHIALPYTAVAAGHTFFLSEKAGTDEGVTYDLSVYKVTYDLVDNGAGTITPENITITRIKDTKGQAVNETVSAMVFENTYRAPDAQLDLFGKKHFDGGRDLVEGEFSFVLKDEAGEIVETVTNGADGVFSFDTLIFDTVGSYKFTVSEVKGTDEKVTYDSTVYEILVTVTYENGEMKAVAEVSGEPMTEYGFTNIFTPDDASITVDVQKILDNKTDKVMGLDGFAFQLKGLDNSTDKTVVSDAQGAAQFQLTYTLADVGKTFTYNLTEAAGDVENMTYDTKVYKIVVTVGQDPTTGALKLTVTRDGAAATGSATFTNVYEIPYEEPPKTFDAAQPMLVAMMGLAAVGMLAVLVIGKKFAE